MRTLTLNDMNLLRSKAKRRDMDFSKSRRAPTEMNLGNFKLWRLSTGETLLGERFDATDVEVRDFINAEIARLDALAGRYRAPRNTTVATA